MTDETMHTEAPAEGDAVPTQLPAPEPAPDEPPAEAPVTEGPGALPDGSWHSDVNSTYGEGAGAALKAAAAMHSGLEGTPDEAQVEAAAAAAEQLLSSGAFGEGPFSVKVSGHAGGGDTGHFSLHVRDAAENE